MDIEYAGKLALMPLPETAASAAGTIAVALALLYRQTLAGSAGAKPFRVTVVEISSAVLLRTTTVSIESDRCAAKIERRSASLVTACTPVSPKAPPMPS